MLDSNNLELGIIGNCHSSDSLVRKFIEYSTNSKHNYIIFCHKKILNKYESF